LTRVGRFLRASVTVGAGEFFRGRRILIQRRVGGHWSNIRAGFLRQSSSELALDAVSAAKIPVTVIGVPTKSVLRAVVPTSSVGPCFIRGTSAVYIL
jgi:hypothetical protein